MESQKRTRTCFSCHVNAPDAVSPPTQTALSAANERSLLHHTTRIPHRDLQSNACHTHGNTGPVGLLYWMPKLTFLSLKWNPIATKTGCVDSTVSGEKGHFLSQKRGFAAAVDTTDSCPSCRSPPGVARHKLHDGCSHRRVPGWRLSPDCHRQKQQNLTW